MPDERDDVQEVAQARSFWSGVITFGLVSVPVHLFPAIRSRGVSLRMLAPDGSPLSRRYYCPEEDRPIERTEIIRGYEVEPGAFVLVSDDELEALEPGKSREIDLRRFVPVEQIDPVYFERAYYLTPAGETTKAYRLLARAMQDSGRAGIATFVMRGREYLVAILAENGILRAETLRFHDEIRTPEDVGLPDPRDAAESVVGAMFRAIESAAEDELSTAELGDTYAAELRELVERKLERADDIVQPAEAVAGDEADVIDLMEVLKRSLRQPAGPGDGEAGDGEAGDSGAATPAAGPDGGGDAGGDAAGPDGGEPTATGAADGGPDLRSRTKAELYERARELDIPGRSGMSKEELIDAIERAS